jgi:hypothetical protein
MIDLLRRQIPEIEGFEDSSLGGLARSILQQREVKRQSSRRNHYVLVLFAGDGLLEKLEGESCIRIDECSGGLLPHRVVRSGKPGN